MAWAAALHQKPEMLIAPLAVVASAVMAVSDRGPLGEIDFRLQGWQCEITHFAMRHSAQMLGYGRQSGQQVDALVHASFDVDDGVRNDAVRALEVLAGREAGLGEKDPGRSRYPPASVWRVVAS